MSYLRTSILAAILAIPASLGHANETSGLECEALTAEMTANELKSYESLGFQSEQDIVDFCTDLSALPAEDLALAISSLELDGLENIISGLDNLITDLPAINEDEISVEPLVND